MNRNLVVMLVLVLAVQVCRGGSQWTKAVPSRGSRNYYVSVKDKPSNSGSRHGPWDIKSVFEGKVVQSKNQQAWLKDGKKKRR